MVAIKEAICPKYQRSIPSKKTITITTVNAAQEVKSRPTIASPELAESRSVVTARS
jgi:hypothetical protein